MYLKYLLVYHIWEICTCCHTPQLALCCLCVGYAFLLFRDEVSVHRLVKNCVMDEGKLFMFVSSVTQTNKKVRLGSVLEC